MLVMQFWLPSRSLNALLFHSVVQREAHGVDTLWKGLSLDLELIEHVISQDPEFQKHATQILRKMLEQEEAELQVGHVPLNCCSQDCRCFDTFPASSSRCSTVDQLDRLFGRPWGRSTRGTRRRRWRSGLKVPRGERNKSGSRSSRIWSEHSARLSLLSSIDQIISLVESCRRLGASVMCSAVQCCAVPLVAPVQDDVSLPLQEGTRSESFTDYVTAGEGVYLPFPHECWNIQLVLLKQSVVSQFMVLAVRSLL